MAEIKEQYLYKGQLLKTVDGDTIDVLISLGFNISFKCRLRLYGVNTPETRGKSKKAGLEAKQFVFNQLHEKDLIIETIKDKKGKYGRYLARIHYDGKCLNDELLRLGYAKPFPSKT